MHSIYIEASLGFQQEILLGRVSFGFFYRKPFWNSSKNCSRSSFRDCCRSFFFPKFQHQFTQVLSGIAISVPSETSICGKNKFKLKFPNIKKETSILDSSKRFYWNRWVNSPGFRTVFSPFRVRAVMSFSLGMPQRFLSGILYCSFWRNP